MDSYEIDENRYGVGSGTNNDEQTGVENTAALGVDDNEEVVVKKRKVMPKLDSDRLLSDKGIPQLRTKVIPNIKLKGKGHEKGDIRRILYSYQMWAHTLFPKAKFEDFIELARRAGKEPSMKVHRRQWIENEKYGYDFSRVTRDIGSLDSAARDTRSPEIENENGQANVTESHNPQNNPSEGENDLFMGGMGFEDDDDDDMPIVMPSHNNSSSSRQRVFGDDEDDDDLYDKPTEQTNGSSNGASNNKDDNDKDKDKDIPQDDELEELMTSRHADKEKEKETRLPENGDDIPGDDELEELMHTTSSTNNQQNPEIPDQDDDFEADAMAAAGELGF